MATSRLAIYNGALILCGSRKIASLTVEEEGRRVLDEVWNDGGVRYCLEMGQWQFAMRSVRLDYDPAIDPEFGYHRAFAKPTDWVNTSALCSDEFFQVPLLQYTDEVGYWYADLDMIYVRYVSDDAAFGGDLSLWPYSFTEYVKAYFASRIIRRLPGGDAKVADICDPKRGVAALALKVAKNKDAQAEPTRYPAQGSWVGSRRGRRWGPMGDGGGSGSLTG